MTGLFDGETPELSESKSRSKKLELLQRRKPGRIQDSILRRCIEKYRAMFAFIFSNDDVNDDEDEPSEKRKRI